MRQCKRCGAPFLGQMQACATVPARSLLRVKESMDRAASISAVIQVLQSVVDCKSF